MVLNMGVDQSLYILVSSRDRHIHKIRGPSMC